MATCQNSNCNAYIPESDAFCASCGNSRHGGSVNLPVVRDHYPPPPPLVVTDDQPIKDSCIEVVQEDWPTRGRLIAIVPATDVQGYTTVKLVMRVPTEDVIGEYRKQIDEMKKAIENLKHEVASMASIVKVRDQDIDRLKDEQVDIRARLNEARTAKREVTDAARALEDVIAKVRRSIGQKQLDEIVRGDP